MTSTGKDFNRMTMYGHMSESDQSKGLPQPPLFLAPDPAWPVTDLPKAQDIAIKSVDLAGLLEQRETLRRYADTPLSLQELSFLLWATQGVKKVTDRPVTLRTVPSAGARHAFETYFLANRVDGLTPGLYFYIASSHTVAAVNLDEDIGDTIMQAGLSQGHIRGSAVTFIWTAVAYRMTYRYVERGYRYLYLDAGHVCQNLYLASEAVGCGTCAVGAFIDEAVNAALNLDGEEQFAIYMATVGKRA